MIQCRESLLAACLVLMGCSENTSSQDTAAAPDVSAENAIPNLSAGPHLGYIVGFDALSPQQMTNADARFAESVAAGMRLSRAQLGWDELETAPGVFNQNLLTSTLDATTVADQQLFFSLTTLDTGSLTMPSDLTSSDALSPATGLNLDGPEIAARFQAFLDWLIPELDSYNIWGLALANESSTLFDSIPQQDITNFLIASAGHASALTDEIAITATIAGGADSNPQITRFIADLMPHFDLASFNFYCLDSNTLQATNQATWQVAIDTFVTRAQGRPVYFQELGCPAGWGDLGGDAATPPESINATPQIQSDFFRFMFEQIETREELRAATVFQLNDWSPELAASFTDLLTSDGEEVFAVRLEEWLATIGLCRWSDGTCRESYDVFIEALALTSASRSRSNGDTLVD